MTICPSVDPVISISIELLPEFGFTVQDEPVYGPGSVFQGIVHLKMKETPVAADRIVIAFRGAENATAIHDGIKFLVPLLKNPFFVSFYYSDADDSVSPLYGTPFVPMQV